MTRSTKQPAAAAPARASRKKTETVTEAETAPADATLATGKLGILVARLRDPNGATVAALAAATGWQVHSVRGAMSGALKKRLKLTITSEKTDAGRVYRIVEGQAA